MAVINIAAITGITVPAPGGIPVTTIIENAQYTGVVVWGGTPAFFGVSTIYTAYITLTAKAGFTLAGVAGNFFTVAGASATNPPDSGTVTAAFPRTPDLGTFCTYDGNNLQTDNIIISLIDHESTPTKNAVLYALAHANKSVIPYINYPNRIVKIAGKVTAASIAALDTALDTFKSYFNGQDKYLDVGYGGGLRRYIATTDTPVIIDRPGGLAFANFAIEFVCTIPFGLDISATAALAATGRTSGVYNDNYTFLGSAPYQLPIVTLTMTTIPDADSRQIIWGNGNNGQVIAINRIFTSGDIVIIDCVEKTVTVNGLPVAFTGGFPAFPLGAQVFQYSDTFTSRTFDVGVSYLKRFM